MTAGANGMDEMRVLARRQLKEAMVARDAEDIEPLRRAIEAAGEARLAEADVAPARALLAKLDAQFLPVAYTDVPQAEMDRLLAASSREEAVGILMRCMGLSLSDGFQSEVLAEFHYHNFMFCKRSRFSAEQASAFLSIMKALHSRAIVEERMPEAEARVLFEAVLARHSRQLPPFSVGAFSEEEALAIKEYVCRGFFRHLKMHAYIFDQRQELVVSTVERVVVPKVLPAFELHKNFEVNPDEVPELQDYFYELQALQRSEDGLDAGATATGPAAPSAMSGNLRRGVSAISAVSAGGSVQVLAPEPTRAVDPATKAEVEAAMNNAMQAHWESLDQRLAMLPE